MEAKDAEMGKFQQQLQDKDDEINRLRRELVKGKVHIVSMHMHEAAVPAWFVSMCNCKTCWYEYNYEYYGALCKWRVLKEQASYQWIYGNYGAITNYHKVSNIGAPQK